MTFVEATWLIASSTSKKIPRELDGLPHSPNEGGSISPSTSPSEMNQQVFGFPICNKTFPIVGSHKSASLN